MLSRFVFLAIVILFLPSCFNLVSDTKCCQPVTSYSIGKGLYVEKYRTFCGGVFGEMKECYVTDSTSFRVLVGSYDEHESFYVKLNGDNVEAYNFQTNLINDTVGRKIFTKDELWKYHHSDKNCLGTNPVFGKNTITCDSDYYPAWSNEVNSGFYMSEVQYKCSNSYLNAVFFTDSTHFSVLVGIHDAGSLENNYSVVPLPGNRFAFYNVNAKSKLDTLNFKSYPLPDLKKEKLIKVCR